MTQAAYWLMTQPGDIVAWGLSEWTTETTGRMITALLAALVVSVIGGDCLRRAGHRVTTGRWIGTTLGLMAVSVVLMILIRGLVY